MYPVVFGTHLSYRDISSRFAMYNPHANFWGGGRKEMTIVPSSIRVLYSSPSDNSALSLHERERSYLPAHQALAGYLPRYLGADLDQQVGTIV